MNKSLRILLVEDNQMAQLAAKISLKALGCLVDITPTGKKAVIFAEENRYDLIFMDIGLSDMDGFEVTQIIRLRGKNLKTPIAALTAHEDSDSQKRAFDVGMNEYIVKPLTIEKAQIIIDSFYPE